MVKDCSYIKSPLVKLIDLFDEGILYLKNTPQKRYAANSTTMAVWDLIDGERTAEDIVRELATIGEVNTTEIEDSIYQLLVKLHHLCFVEEVNGTSV